MFLRSVSIIIRRHAGHSKWQNIRHTKALKDGQKSILFSKLGHRIRISIQDNGNNPNPDTNFHLSQVIEIAKKNDMPLSTIQGFIKATQSDKKIAKPFKISIRGPKGSILLVSTLTSATKKTRDEIISSLKKIGGIVADQSLESSFSKTGIVIASPPPDASDIEETSVDHAIEAGAEEVSPLDENKKLTFSCDVSVLHKVKTKLEELKYTVEEANFSYVPKMKVSLNEDEMNLVSKIIAKVEEHPDVMDIFDNID